MSKTVSALVKHPSLVEADNKHTSNYLRCGGGKYYKYSKAGRDLERGDCNGWESLSDKATPEQSSEGLWVSEGMGFQTTRAARARELNGSVPCSKRAHDTTVDAGSWEEGGGQGQGSQSLVIELRCSHVILRAMESH